MSIACTADSDEPPAGELDPFDGGAGPMTNRCDECVVVECVAASALCLTDERCLARRLCGAGGAGEACTSSCIASADGGTDEVEDGSYGAFASCIEGRACRECARHCGSGGQCTVVSSGPSTCGDLDAGTPDAAPAAGIEGTGDGGDAGDGGVEDAGIPRGPSVGACADCVDAACVSALRACGIGSECTTFLTCISGCEDRACAAGCERRHSTGRPAALELASCARTSCRPPCGLRFDN